MMAEAEEALQKVTGLPLEALLWALVVGIAALEIYNLICAARKNAREQMQLKEQPTQTIEDRLAAHAKMLDTDKRRLDEMERKQSDMQRGQMVNCAGVQALLEHELHNGNTAEMQDASHAIDKWLRERP